MTQDNLILELTDQLIELKNNVLELQTLIADAKLSKLSNTIDEINSIGILEWLNEDLEITKQTLDIERKLNNMDMFFNRVQDLKERYLILKSEYFTKFVKTNEEIDDMIDTSIKNVEEKYDELYEKEKLREEVKEDLSKKSEEELKNMYGYSEFIKD